jgi:hypothetical protein
VQCAGGVERSETHHLRGCRVDGYRCAPPILHSCAIRILRAEPKHTWRAQQTRVLNHPVPGERGAHLLVNADGSFLSAYRLREHPAARDRVCAGNAWIEIGRSARESAFAAGRKPMKQRVVPMLMPTEGSTGPNAAERNPQFGARRPGDVSHCSMWTAVSACRALRSSRSRSMPGGVPRASFRRRCAWSVRR